MATLGVAGPTNLSLGYREEESQWVKVVEMFSILEVLEYGISMTQEKMQRIEEN